MIKLTTYVKYKFLILHRKSESFGINYVLLYPLIFFIFYILSIKLSKYSYGEYIFIFLSIPFMFEFTLKKKEIEWLSLLDRRPYFYVCIINIFSGIPFLIFSVYMGYYIALFLLIISILLFSFLKFKISFSFLEKINLSFLMIDFEFITGFRRLWYLHLISIILFVIGLNTQNYNISFFGYFLFLIIIGFYYEKTDPLYLVWILVCNTEYLLKKKITSITKKIFLVSIPFIAVFLFFSIDFFIFYVLLVSLLGIINSALSKYINVNNGLTIPLYLVFSITFSVLCFVNPIYLLVNLGYYYFLQKKAEQNLNKILNNE